MKGTQAIYILPGLCFSIQNVLFGELIFPSDNSKIVFEYLCKWWSSFVFKFVIHDWEKKNVIGISKRARVTRARTRA